MSAPETAGSNKDCRFCTLVQEPKICHIVYEDDLVLAFLDRHPVNPGHTLVIPRTHIANFQDIPETTWSHLMLVAQRIAKVLEATLKPERVGILVAGFDIDHAHVHVVPLQSREDVSTKRVRDSDWAEPDPGTLEAVAIRLRRQLSEGCP